MFNHFSVCKTDKNRAGSAMQTVIMAILNINLCTDIAVPFAFALIKILLTNYIPNKGT